MDCNLLICISIRQHSLALLYLESCIIYQFSKIPFTPYNFINAPNYTTRLATKYSAGLIISLTEFLSSGQFFLTVRILTYVKKHARKASLLYAFSVFTILGYERVLEYLQFPAAQSVARLHILYDFNERRSSIS